MRKWADEVGLVVWEVANVGTVVKDVSLSRSLKRLPRVEKPSLYILLIEKCQKAKYSCCRPRKPRAMIICMATSNRLCWCTSTISYTWKLCSIVSLFSKQLKVWLPGFFLLLFSSRHVKSRKRAVVCHVATIADN